MPIVVSHAFMFDMPAIVSDAVGQASLPGGAPGLATVPAGNTRELSGAMAGFIESHQAGRTPCAATRALFDAYFSVDMFERALKRLVGGRLCV